MWKATGFFCLTAQWAPESGVILKAYKEIGVALLLATGCMGIAIGVAQLRTDKPSPGTIGSADRCRCCSHCSCATEGDCPLKKPVQFVNR